MLTMTVQRWCSEDKQNNEQTMIAASTVYSWVMVNQCSVHSVKVTCQLALSVEPEESDNFELGYRSSQPGSYLEVVGFLCRLRQL